MESSTHMGLNRTGIQMSPVDTDQMIEGVARMRPSDSDETMVEMRSDYIAEAEPVGTVPVPGNVKGVAKTVAKKLTGKRPEVFIDKLGERLAFERTGTRLYDALLTKFEVIEDGTHSVPIDMLRQFRNQEAAHFELLAQCMEEIGADPTAQTPCADVTGVEALGLLQVLSDPRTTPAQSLNAILIAELADNAGWELLSALAEDMGQTEMAERFQRALAEEEKHLAHIKTWHEQAVFSGQV
jgi:hypothetical protein